MTHLQQQAPVLSELHLAQLDKQFVPRHIAIIPDGNRRWAECNAKELGKGHIRGSQVVIDILKASAQIGVKVLTFYTFSTENWSRSVREVDFLMQLFGKNLEESLPVMIENGVRLSTIGDLSRLASHITSAIESAKKQTASGKTIELVLALNYGGRDEICRASRQLALQCLQGHLQPCEIDETRFAQALDSSHWQDPDLLIRTSGEARISNFLLWQLAYTELYFCKKLWPDFTPEAFLDAVIDYQKRQRRKGK